MATFRGKEGIWRTMDNGVHIFIANGQSLDDAIKGLKPREYNKYWLRNEDSEWESYSGVSKKEYEKAIAKGREGKIEPFKENWGSRIPEDMEYRMWNALESIKDANGPGDFRNKLKKALWGNGIDWNNYNTILDAFSDDIVNKYNSLIKPRVDEINKIDIDNSYEYFEKNIDKQNVSDRFKKVLKDRFDECKDEKLKTLAATATELGLSFSENEKKSPLFGDRIGTCYIPALNQVNILDGDEDLDTIFHEMHHGIFEKYNIIESGLNETLKNEFNKKKVKEIKKYFGLEEYCKRNNIDYDKIKSDYDNADKEVKEARNYLNKIYSEELEKIGDKSMAGYQKLRQVLENHDEYQNADIIYKESFNKFLNIEKEMKKIERYANSELTDLYPNFADMCSGATNNSFGYGHPRSYWKDDETNQVNEFFAEISAIKATGNNEELEMIKKFLPETVKKYEEVIDNILKNKGEALEL